MNRLNYLYAKEFKDMTLEEQEEYKSYKWDTITRYMGVPTTSESSLRLRTKAFLEETRTGFWDQEKTDDGKR